MRQKNMHLSPDTKKRKGAAHGYANMLAARSNPTSLATALLGPEAVAVGVPLQLFRMRAICCNKSCPNRVSCGGPACIMAVGGSSK